MKTLTRTIIVLVALSMLVTAFAQAQTSQPVTPSPTPSILMSAPTPTPAPPTPPTLPSPGSVDLVADELFRSVSFGSRSGSAGTVLVIPSEQTTTEDLLTINEDMNVMSRIFEKNLDQERIATVTSSIFLPGRRSPYGMLLGSSRNEIQSMYLQGFGALFLLKVDFPLSPPPDVQEQEQETQKAEEGDPVWQEMRQEMYEPEKVDRRDRTDHQESKYEPEKVENLKTTLIKALKHAANIRSLKKDESVILTVIGSGEASGDTTMVTTRRTIMVNGHKRIISEPFQVSTGLPSRTAVVIRTTRSKIDDFAKGDLDFDKFREQVQVLTYPLLGGADDGHRNPFDAYYGSRSTGYSNRR